jgi:nitroimidazol reductase NimA-like FMN-containing flavoprotein (pyridoxamine 5'-phosphate oxidase superfamily)
MGLDHVSFVYTTGMDEEEVEARLSAAATGTLSLAKDDDSYALPVAVDWDGETINLRLGIEPDSDKTAFLEATRTATIVCYGYEDVEESWSVIVRGPLRNCGPPGANDHDEAWVNQVFPPLRVFDESIDDLEPVLYALNPDEISGRRTAGN